MLKQTLTSITISVVNAIIVFGLSSPSQAQQHHNARTPEELEALAQAAEAPPSEFAYYLPLPESKVLKMSVEKEAQALLNAFLNSPYEGDEKDPHRAAKNQIMFLHLLGKMRADKTFAPAQQHYSPREHLIFDELNRTSSGPLVSTLWSRLPEARRNEINNADLLRIVEGLEARVRVKSSSSQPHSEIYQADKRRLEAAIKKAPFPGVR